MPTSVNERGLSLVGVDFVLLAGVSAKWPDPLSHGAADFSQRSPCNHVGICVSTSKSEGSGMESNKALIWGFVLHQIATRLIVARIINS